MEELIKLFFNEIYQILFVSSIIYIIYIISNFTIKLYGRFKLDRETRVVLTPIEKIFLWVSIALTLTYIL